MSLSRPFSDPIIGVTQEMQDICKSALQIAASKTTVLLRGESGTGKELIAKLIHEKSPRAGKPFIRVNCAALSEALLESELFGHEKGAFTGATQTRRGRFEIASGGTIFLDEIGDLSPTVQVKLLRVLQEMEFERVGGNETLTVDVRVIAATHRPLEQGLADGTFRHDLYYRINVLPLHLPALRDRKADIPLLIEHFLLKFNKENGKEVNLSPGLIDLLVQYDWPGNVRELENCVERLVVLAEGKTVTRKTVPSAIATYFHDIRQVTARPPSVRSGSWAKTMAQMEQEALKKTLDRCGWVQAKAARSLGLTRRQVAYKIQKYRLVPPEDEPI